ncbi:MAG: hypothetical protein HQL76_17950, partial [Magnetococcales bacterium]|nr:hypothetical protein [Magnetococcales bacterium]
RAHKNELINMLRAEAPADPGSKPSLPPGRMISERDSGHQTESSLACGCEVFEERAAIIEHEGGIPREWAEGMALLLVMPRPQDIPLARWHKVLRAVGVFIERHGKEVDRLGWTTEEIFGVHATRPSVRFGSQGLVYCLADSNVTLERLTRDEAIFRTSGGAKQTFRRATHNLDGSALRMLWDRGGIQ